jgi:hypothetical protein
MNLSKTAKATRVVNGAVAGTGTTNGSSVDMQGFGACQFTFLIGAITAGGSVTCKVQQSSDDGSSDSFTDLLGTAIALSDADGDKVAVIDVVEPLERYLRPVIVRADENAVIDGVVAQQYWPSVEPVVHDSVTVESSEFHASPAEGTA